MSYHDEPADPSVVRALVKRARAAFADGQRTYLCAQRFATADGPALYIARRTEAEAAAATIGGSAQATLSTAPVMVPTYAAGMIAESAVWQIEVTP